MEVLTDEQAKQLVNENEAAPAEGDDLSEHPGAAGAAWAEAEGAAEPQITFPTEEEQAEEAEKTQLLVNGVIEWAVGLVQQCQQQMGQIIPQGYQFNNANQRLDEGKLWLLSMYDDELAAKHAEEQAANPTQNSPDIWVPEAAGEVEVPTLQVVGEKGSSPEPPASATAEGGS